MKKYNHLTQEEHEQIMVMYYQGMKPSHIATKMGRNRSTITRELQRNSTAAGYSAQHAQREYKERRKDCHPKKKLDDPDIHQFVCDHLLKDQWSPEQISGRLMFEQSKMSISFMTIYRSIKDGSIKALDCDQSCS